MSIKNKVKAALFAIKEPPLTGGNGFVTKHKLDAQVSIDMANLENNPNASAVINGVKNEVVGVSSTSGQYIKERTLETYWLLQLQANYFCNTISFKCNNWSVRAAIIKVIRCAFINGTAGIYINEAKKMQPVSIISCELDSLGNPVSYKVMPIDLALASQSMKYDENSLSQSFEITEERNNISKNFFEFKWGTCGISAWVIMMPFIRQQQSMLTMLNTLAFSYIKKYVYTVNDPNSVKTEMELYFDATNPFLVDAGISNGLGNKIKTVDITGGGSSSKDFLDYYNESIKIWYELFGRRMNSDDKKERNIQMEVEATQRSYNDVQEDYKQQFRIFIQKLRECEYMVGLELQEEKEIEDLENEKILEKSGEI